MLLKVVLGSKIVLLLDGWFSINKYSFLGVLAHYFIAE
jgi:NADH:ubiquinone oxidoreductase subunit H